MKIVYGYCFSDNENYLTETGILSGWDLIHNYLEEKLLLPQYKKLQLIRFNITDKNTKYCLAIKQYNECNNYLKIPYNEMKKDQKTLDLNDYHNYYHLLKECKLKTIDLFQPDFIVIN